MPVTVHVGNQKMIDIAFKMQTEFLVQWTTNAGILYGY